MSKEMLINVSAGEECRIAVVEDGRLEELYMERTSATSHVGNIYKGKVTNVEASIQAAFIDFGLGRNGFLHISDLMPTYFGRKGEDVQESVGRKMSRRDRPPIQRCLRRGDEIIVQIIKEGIGTKGPTLSTYLSIPGKMLVMMPGMAKMGVSKKIEDDQERRRLRQILDSLKPPHEVAFIIRTAGIGKSKEEIERDLNYLVRLWENIEDARQQPGPVELYTEGDLVTRTVRDVYTEDIDRVVVDDETVARRVRDVIRISDPAAARKVEFDSGPIPLFHQWGVDREIEQMYSRHVPLPSGGSLVIDSTEAIVAIDVNSGKNRDNNDAEMTAFKTDMEAAEEIPRQLKLRDLGGVIICDFIDLRYERHRRELEERLFENFKNDRAKTKVLRMSQFGIIEITRQRMRPSLEKSIYFDCPHCKGAGLVKTPESMALDVVRKLSVALHDGRVVRAEVAVCKDVAEFLLNKKRSALSDLEHKTGKRVVVKFDTSLALDEVKFELSDSRDGQVVLEEIGMTVPGGDRRNGRGDQRNRGNRNRGGQIKSKPLPDDDRDEMDEDRMAIERGADLVEERLGPTTKHREPMADREADPDDIPAILETEAGDEVAEELADEMEGAGQSADVRDDSEADERDGEEGVRDQAARDDGDRDEEADEQDDQGPDANRAAAGPGGSQSSDDDYEDEDEFNVNRADGPPIHEMTRRDYEIAAAKRAKYGDRRGGGKFNRGRGGGGGGGGGQQSNRNPNFRPQGAGQGGQGGQGGQPGSFRNDRPPVDNRQGGGRNFNQSRGQQGRNEPYRNDQGRNEPYRNDQGRGQGRNDQGRGDRPGYGQGAQGVPAYQGGQGQQPYNGPQGGQGGQARDPNLPPGEGEGGGRRRRRRRGRRGRGRGGEGQQFDPNRPQSNDPMNPQRDDTRAAQPYGDEFRDEGYDPETPQVPGEYGGEMADRVADEFADDQDRDQSPAAPVELKPTLAEPSDAVLPVAELSTGDRRDVETTDAEAPAPKRRGRRKAEPVAKDDSDAGGVVVINDDDFVTGEKSAKAPKAKGRAKKAPEPKELKAKAPKGKAKAAPKAAAVKVAAPKAKPKRTPPKKGESAAPTGSADKHLNDDEPVDPQPLRRPRSYADLDAIPDDYD